MYFETDYTDNVSLDFRYSAAGADMLIGSDLYHFEGPPTEGDGNLFWQHEFPDRDIKVTVSCTLPQATPSAGSTSGTSGTSASPGPSSPSATT